MKKRTTTETSPDLTPRTRRGRRRQELAQRKAATKARRALRRHNVAPDGRKLSRLFTSPPPTSTYVNPKRDEKSLRSGRLRKELQP